VFEYDNEAASILTTTLSAVKEMLAAAAEQNSDVDRRLSRRQPTERLPFVNNTCK